jgi:8-oxo-dGTP diphosphatase
MNEPCFYRVSVKALVVDEFGKFLLVKESDGTWELLGGGLDHGEDPIAALKREIHEETGLEVVSVSPCPAYFITAERAEHGFFIANILYRVTLKDLAFTPSDECQELRYFSVDEARKEHLLPNVEKFLEVYTVE